MTTEQPLVSIGEIAHHLKCSKDTARKELKRNRVPTFKIGRHIAVYPSTLKTCLERTYYVTQPPESVLTMPESIL